MARWFPSGLSAISGQISNFTREVLADGVEEIDDHVTELRNAKSRVKELESASMSLRAEMDRLQQLNDELSVELQSHELQKTKLSENFRAEVARKEEELKLMKSQQAEYMEHFQQLSDHQSSQSTANHGFSSAQGDVHSEDFGDLISSQQEINQLRGSVRRLTAEVQHWRQLSTSLQAGESCSAVNDSSTKVTQLQAEIEELRRNLTSTVDEHQTQLSSLQNVHRQTVNSLKLSHSKTVEQLQKQLKSSVNPDATEPEKLTCLQDQLRDAEKIRQKLEYDLEHTHAADSKKARVIDELSEKLNSSETDRNKLAERVSEMAEEVKQLTAEKHELLANMHDLSSACTQLNQLKQEQHSAAAVSAECSDGHNDTTLPSSGQCDGDLSSTDCSELLVRNQQLVSQVSRAGEKEQRLLKECHRLRGHLVQIEDSYTREALEAEEREKLLRNRLAAAEEKVLSSSSAITCAKRDSAKQIESLQLQLHTLAEQRDNALLQLSSAQETIANYSTSLANLQMVLEQFQAERQQQQSLEIERYKRDWQREHDAADALRQQLQTVQTQLDETAEALDAAHRLSDQLDRKEAMIAALREEVHVREAELARVEEQLSKVTSCNDAKIDKIIIKNLLLGYFHTPPAKRQEALQIIGQVLSYSRDEMKEIAELNESSGSASWIGGLFRRKAAANTSESTAAGNPYSSFSELFVKFLERESAPPPGPLRLPVERLAQEQQQKQQQQRRATPTFNPFSTSVLNSSQPSASASALIIPSLSVAPSAGEQSESLHPLMRPISPPRIPVFAPASEHGAVTPMSAGRDSASSSGRSTPSASGGSILRDILQQR